MPSDSGHDRVPSPKTDDIVVAPTAAHRRFLHLLHDLDAVVWEMDAASWRFTYVSEGAERIFGYPIALWYDDPVFWQDRLLHPDDREWCVRHCSSATEECRHHAFLYRARCADGRVRWIKDLVRVMTDERGRARAMRGVIADVTDEPGFAAPLRGAEIDYHAAEQADLRSFVQPAA